MAQEWNAMVCLGSAAFVVKEKFKRLKVSLRKWNTEVFGWIDMRVEEEVKKINSCDDDFVSIFGGHHDGDWESVELQGSVISNVKREATRSFWNNLHRKESLILQKSIIKWCKEEDSNTRFSTVW